MTTEPTRSRPRWIRGLLLGLGAVIALRLLGMVLLRSRRPAVLDRTRVVNKRVVNPPMLAMAGRGHWYASRLEHVGRRSGKAYSTPIIALPMAGGFAIPLPYGTRVDWLRNLQAAGNATLRVKGTRHGVGDPQVVETDTMLSDLPPYWRLAARMYSIDHFVRLTATAAAAEPVAAADRAAVLPEPVDVDA
jgi:deazaflavin-dependent oxidoreductase (nitroreductase family)